MKHVIFIMAIICMTLASGCSTREKQIDDPLTPLPAVSIAKDPGNGALMAAAASYIKAKKGPGNTQYEFTRLDLDNDGRREGIILMKSPHQFWCGFNGCQMAVFKAQNDGFTLLSEVAPVRGPLTVSEHTTNGWKDIIVRVSGRMNTETKDVALQYDGRSYPAQPAFVPPVRYAYNNLAGVRIFP